MLYFAYGSNLHPERLRRRVPSREAIGIATLSGHELTFTKRGQDGSGKCALIPSAYHQAAVYGMLYRMAPADRRSLDLAEDLAGGGYEAIQISVTMTGGPLQQAFTYVPSSRHIDELIKPFDWYKAFVVHGARFHGLPPAWIERLEAVPAIADHDDARAKENARILASLT